MTIDLLKELVNNSDLSQIQKNVLIGFIKRTELEQEKNCEDRNLIEQVANEKKLSEVVLSTDEVKIYTVYGKDDWDIKYPFRSIYLNKKGTWERSYTVSPSLDLAFLVYLENKYLGQHKHFVEFVMKMLGLDPESV